MFYQQGDVLLRKVSSIPSGAVKENKKCRIVLAEGETTGHAHAIADIDSVDTFIAGNDRFLEVKKETVLNHEEHNAICVSAGLYKIGIVQEYDHFVEEARNVQD